jgi:DNA modification methylase
VTNLDLFGGEIDSTDNREMSIIPVSVIDVWKQSSHLRDIGNHYAKSSRLQYSPFPEEVSRVCYELYLRDCKHIFDPFAGWGERGFFAKEYCKEYTGFDINAMAIQHAEDHYGIQNDLADSYTVKLPKFDGLFTCPPYWNLERYTDQGIDAAKTWKDFLFRYSFIFHKAYEVADTGSMFCIMVGDWRKDGVYYDIAHQTRKIFEDLGATTIDDVVISRKGVSKITIMLPQAKRLGYSVKVHSSLLVFKKGIS